MAPAKRNLTLPQLALQLTTAYKLLLAEPSASVVLLEARQASSGATGRNGGHCRPGDYLGFKNNVDLIGVEEALRVENLEETKVRAVAALVEEHGIDCDFRARESLDVFVDPKQWEAALEALKARDLMELSRGDGVSGDGDLIFGVGSWHRKVGIQRTFDDTTLHPEISEYLTNAATNLFGLG
ncbi:hypothetical protein VC83_01685 [Pseudogymnoascus destructans]|uniref:FAD dependent oxidoreductase domain-containing protein n=2 Tax=Pseudogymnoascus destructans TaxID=655981 RepID=L8G5N7_PSED2|nr:uncharacterized protein VC83_01685 [Pseudogymnoascus destructans]ELR07281.1 hypothetical protein GMDG_08352 [Pseudogymnoascus destructans 20631-21]OAF61893.1 hypothetical protein VC83_01685 [Pseudogymnoascus destructans]